MILKRQAAKMIEPSKNHDDVIVLAYLLILRFL